MNVRSAFANLTPHATSEDALADHAARRYLPIIGRLRPFSLAHSMAIS